MEREGIYQYARDCGVEIGQTYFLEGERVVPFAEDDDFDSLAALGHGWVHYHLPDGTVKFGGIFWFAENVKCVAGG